ncbi:DNA-binding transcriptional LysR family regulator [Streptomyces sp. PvR006]|uniref:LysR family transcriptional regulator n=1 Tax=Streptomyces sp. PvR006 TaxID=2817860 RepID=UPI001AE45078|nr:LysR family transcriptional regulator [Streptomyces sp. PvR006]MBP2579848.1 DNA-binding transcriptional LysR family regulator [Streptomyces sp. PvR006]
MELRQLRYFVTVAEEGGFGRAAERLSIVPSAVSQQIARLERAWGVVLFDRTTRRVRLSSAGERMLPEARAVLAAADRTARVAVDIAAGEDGILRLGIVHGPEDRLNRILAGLTAGAPLLQVRLRSLPVAERLAAVRSGELEAALVRAVGSAAGLTLLPLWRDPLHVAVPASHPLAAEPVLRLPQLASLPLRLAPREDNAPFHDLILGACRAAGAVPPAGPPFTGLQATLTAIGTAPTASWTVFYEVRGLPPVPRVALRPLAGLDVTTYLAARPGPPGPALRHLLRSLHEEESEARRHEAAVGGRSRVPPPEGSRWSPG